MAEMRSDSVHALLHPPREKSIRRRRCGTRLHRIVGAATTSRGLRDEFKSEAQDQRVSG